MAALANMQLVKNVCDNNGLKSANGKFALRYLDYYYIDPVAFSKQDVSVDLLTKTTKKFQKQFGLKQTGKIDEAIKESSTTSGGPGYNTPYAFLKPGSKPNDSQYTSVGYTPVNRKALRKKSKGVDYIDLYKTNIIHLKKEKDTKTCL